jgi:predicted transcriptional regulator
MRRLYREQIVRDVSDTAMGDGVAITRIMSKVGLTTLQTKDYIISMISKRLLHKEIKEKSGKLCYKSASRGILYLRMTGAVPDLFRINNTQLN